MGRGSHVKILIIILIKLIGSLKGLALVWYIVSSHEWLYTELHAISLQGKSQDNKLLTSVIVINENNYSQLIKRP